MDIALDALRLLLNPLPRVRVTTHVKEWLKYSYLGLRGIGGHRPPIAPPTSRVELEPSGAWSRFIRELRFTHQHLHPKDYLGSPVIYRTTANPLAAPTIRKVGTCSAEEFVLAVATLLARCYPQADRAQWVNLLAKSQFTNDSLLSSADLPADTFQRHPIIELGAGFGVHSFVNSHAARHPGLNVNYDLADMLVIQRQVIAYLRERSDDPTLFQNLTFSSDHLELRGTIGGTDYGVVSYYAFTEFSLSEREKMVDLLRDARFIIIASNPRFEGVDNFHYVPQLAERLGKTVHEGPVANPNGYQFTARHKAFLLV